MKVEGWLFAAGFFFFALAAVVYWPALAGSRPAPPRWRFTVGLAFLIGFYLLFTGAAASTARPEDNKDAEIADGAGELGFFSPHSWWPLAGRRSSRPSPSSASSSAGGCSSSGLIGGALAVIGLVFEYYRGEPAL